VKSNLTSTKEYGSVVETNMEAIDGKRDSVKRKTIDMHNVSTSKLFKVSNRLYFS
jgi:hypothetical protein